MEEKNKQQLELTRTFDAPRALVWKAWTTPEGWVEWYGKPWVVPKDSAEMDVRSGGHWKSTTIAQGITINFTGDYLEVVEPEKLEMTIRSPEDPLNPLFERVSVTFEEIGSKTEMKFMQKGNLPPEEYDVGLRAGWTGFFDALEKYLLRA